MMSQDILTAVAIESVTRKRRIQELEARLSEAERLLRASCLLIVPDEAWQDRRDQFLEVADATTDSGTTHTETVVGERK